MMPLLADQYLMEKTMKIYEIISEKLTPTNNITTNIKKSIASNNAAFKLGAKNKPGPEQYATFIGKSANNWNSKSNATAIQNHTNGMSAGENWKTTGNFVDPGGNWRQEIDDSNMKFKKITRNPHVDPTVGDGVDHPELGSNYPEITDYNFNPDHNFKKKTVSGRLTKQTYANGKTAPNAVLKKRGLSPNKIDLGNFNQDGTRITNNNKLANLGHEIQHAADGIEGYPAGAPANDAEIKALATQLGVSPHAIYQGDVSELMSRENANRVHQNKEWRKNNIPTFGDTDFIISRDKNGTIGARPNEWNEVVKQNAINKAAMDALKN